MSAIAAEFAAKIEAAAHRVGARRDCAWLAVPFPICGVDLREMTLRDYLTLILSGNAHVTAQPVPADPLEAAGFWAAHDVQLLWLLSPDFRPGDLKARARFISRAAGFSASAVREGLTAYLAETFADARRGGAGADPKQADPLKVSFVACYVHRLASAYGWRVEEIQSLPLKQLFQLVRLCEVDAAYKAGKQPPLAPDETDHLWAQYLAALNASPPSSPPPSFNSQPSTFNSAPAA